jgi:predicted  nucleic acid-binding Zn-ribbon protein
MKKRKRKDGNWLSRLLKIITLILILLLLFNLVKDYNTYLTRLQRTLEDNNQRIHNLEREIVKLKLQNQTYAIVLASHEKRLDQINAPEAEMQLNDTSVQYKENKVTVNENIHNFNIVKYGWYSILIGGLLVLRQILAPTGI